MGDSGASCSSILSPYMGIGLFLFFLPLSIFLVNTFTTFHLYEDVEFCNLLNLGYYGLLMYDLS